MELSACIEMIFHEEPFVDRIQMAAEAGADAIEFWDWRDKDLDAVTKRCAETGVDFAAMLGSSIPLTDPDRTNEAAEDLHESIEVAADYDCPNLIVTVGREQDELERNTQHDAIVTVLDRVATDAEGAGVTLGVEPLNTIVDHPGYYLTSSAEGYEIVETVDSPAVKLLFDIYHQQVSEGNVTRNLTSDIGQVGYVHIADVPGRHEPTTGELNYANVLAALDDAGYDGYVGCEFTPEHDPSAAIENCRNLLSLSN